MAHFDSTRMGRSQGASIFWGLVSLCFAAAACFYYLKSRDNETSANVLRDQAMALQEQRDALSAQKDKLQSANGEAEKQLKTREDLVQEKETKLAAEEARLEAQGGQPPIPKPPDDAQATVIKKFGDTVHKLAKGDDNEVGSRGGRPLLRLPSSAFFGADDAILKPDGKAMLNQLADALDGQLTKFELRVETFTDQAEIDNGLDPAAAKPPAAGAKPAPAPVKSRYTTPWDLTGARAAAISRFFSDQTKLPFRNVVVIARADSDPMPAGKDGHAHNRRIEFTIAPQPEPYHAPDADKTDSSDKNAKGDKSATPPVNPLEPPPEPPAPKKDKAN